MFGYRNGETPVIQVHVKKPKPFKWLRKLFRRMKFKHARFDDGKYSRGQRDIEKWHEDTPLAKADYPDHRWQVLNSRPRSRRGRSKSRDPKPASSAQAKIRVQSEIPSCSSSSEPRGRSPNAAVFMNMDTIKHVLDNDIIGYGKYDGSGSCRQTTSVEVHESNSWRHRYRERVSQAARSAEESMRAHLTRYNTLQVELSPVKTKSKDPKLGNIDCSYPPNAISVLVNNTEEAIESNPHTSIHTDGAHTRNCRATDPHEHEHDNDLNHLQVFDSKSRFNKKPKKRKNRRRRPRRKGKYVELLESEPSTESLVELHEEPRAKGRPKSSCKNERVKCQGKRTLSNPLRTLAVRLRDVAGAPVFHPAKYRGYKRFFDE